MRVRTFLLRFMDGPEGLLVKWDCQAAAWRLEDYEPGELIGETS